MLIIKSYFQMFRLKLFFCVENVLCSILRTFNNPSFNQARTFEGFCIYMDSILRKSCLYFCCNNA